MQRSPHVSHAPSSPPALVIAGTHSGVGKTSIAIALMRALSQRGLQVQPFKVGPDFIDPGHHRRATGRLSHNLDSWMLSATANQALFGQASLYPPADLALIEGVMGLFDGYGDQDEGSTAHLAKLLKVPVVLVLDARAIARSAAAMVLGYQRFDPEVQLAGVILNRVGSASHLERLKRAIAPLGLPVLGGVPRDAAVDIPRRHLGLWLAEEDPLGDRYLDRLAELTHTHLDLDHLLRLAQPAQIPAQILHNPQPNKVEAAIAPVHPARPDAVRLGIARDAAFCFYYDANLQALQTAGAELVPFSPLSDRLPPDLDGVYLGGGYPELHAERLAQNHDLRSQLQTFIQQGKPVYAECGGLMYLCQGLMTEEQQFPFVGVLPFWVRMGQRPTLGYGEVIVQHRNPFFAVGTVARGHRFHYSQLVPMEETAPPTHGSQPYQPCYQLHRWNAAPEPEGFSQGSVLASYVHLHFASCPGLAQQMVQACRTV